MSLGAGMDGGYPGDKRHAVALGWWCQWCLLQRGDGERTGSRQCAALAAHSFWCVARPGWLLRVPWILPRSQPAKLLPRVKQYCINRQRLEPETQLIREQRSTPSRPRIDRGRRTCSFARSSQKGRTLKIHKLWPITLQPARARTNAGSEAELEQERCLRVAGHACGAELSSCTVRCSAAATFSAPAPLSPRTVISFCKPARDEGSVWQWSCAPA